MGKLTLQEFDVNLQQDIENVIEHVKVIATEVEAGHVTLSSAIDSDSTTTAATSLAAKIIYDLLRQTDVNLNELKTEFLTFKSVLTEGFTSNQFSDGLTTLDGFDTVSGYYNQSLSRLEV